MANPASVYCNEIGGKLRMENTVQGQEGICILPNGTEMEEWTLYRKDHPAK
jgi:putative hemolysin